jgi:hypothetical protein
MSVEKLEKTNLIPRNIRYPVSWDLSKPLDEETIRKMQERGWISEKSKKEVLPKVYPAARLYESFCMIKNAKFLPTLQDKNKKGKNKKIIKSNLKKDKEFLEDQCLNILNS